MKGGGLSKLYDQLTVEERFRLRIQALARGDRADCERLDRACPSLQYRDYCDRLDASEVLTLCVMVELLPKLAKLRMLSAVRPLVGYLEAAVEDGAAMGYLDGLDAGWRAAGKRGRPPAVSDEELTAATDRACRLGSRFSKLLDRVEKDLAGRARTPHDALARFAEVELGLSLEDLLSAWAGPVLDELAEHREALEAAEPDAEGLQLLGDVLRLAWRRQGLHDPTDEVDDELRAKIEAAEQRAREAAEL
jgi:hypothetical protein